MNYEKNKTKDFFEKVAFFLANKPLFITITYFLICLGIGLSIFYFYVVVPQEKTFSYQEEISKPNRELFFKINQSWIKKEETIEDEDEEENNQKEEEKEQIIENEEQEVNKEERSNEEMSESELEDVLAETLFELYAFKDGSLPTIEERSLIWEDLGLGKAQVYEGTFSQNILLLEELKKEFPEK